MEAKYMAEHNHYFTAFFSIENGTLFAAVGDRECYDPIFPVVKSSDKEYSFISVVKHQDFVDDVLNGMIVNTKDRNKKFSIVLNGKDSCISSNGTIIFAVSKTAAALHYATRQIYENLEQFIKPHFTGYHEELEIVPKGFVRF
jgi:hypothetical protein